MQDTVSKDRDKYIGGSDIPIIMNLSPFKSRYDLLLEKAGYKANTFEGNIYTEYGNTMEPKIRDHINQDLAKYEEEPFVEGKHIREATEEELIGVRIHTDGERVSVRGTEVLEIKTTSNIHEDIEGYKLYLVQLLFYMVNIGAKYGTLAVYARPDNLSEELDVARLKYFFIAADDYKDLIGEIGRALDLFLEDLEKVKANPFITEEELLPQEIPDITARILALESQLELMKETEKKIKEDKARLKAAMEAASVKSWKTPQGYTITLIEDTPGSIVKKFNEDKFKTDNPELYEGYLEDKVQSGRAGYVKITVPKKKDA